MTNYALRAFGAPVALTPPVETSRSLACRLHLAYVQDTGVRTPGYALRALGAPVSYSAGGSAFVIGTASDGESYTLSGTVSTWSDTGASGSTPQTIVVSGSTIAYSYQALGTTQFTNVEMRVRVSLSDTASAAGMFARFTGTANHYRFVLVGGQLQLVRQLGSAASILATHSIPGFAVGQPYWIRGRLVGNALFGMAWADGTAEPGNWQCYAVNTQLPGAGSVGLLSKLAIAGDTSTFDHFVVVQAIRSFGFIPLRLPLKSQPTPYDLRTRLALFGRSGGDLRTRLTFTGITHDLSTRVPMALAQDSFNRTALPASWGVATDGTNNSIPWSKLGAAATTSTDGVHGLMAMPSGGTIMQLGASLPLIAANLLFQVRTQIGAGGDETGIVMRLVDGNNWYKFDYLDAAPGGGNGYILRIRKCVNGVITTLATFPFVMLPDRWYWLRAMAEGSNLFLSAWLDGQSAPPTNWMVAAIDTSFLNGGIMGLCGNPTTTNPIKYDSLLVYQVPIRNPGLRFRLSFFNGSIHDFFLRLRLVGRQTAQNLLVRLILLNTRNLDLPSRLQVRPQHLRDLAFRLHTLLGGSFNDLATRLSLARARDWHTRLLLQPDPTDTLLSLSLKPAVVGTRRGFVHEGTPNTFETPAGQGTLPVAMQTLTGPYMVGPVALENPDSASAPMSFDGACVPQGSAFTMNYMTPSDTVQNNLVNGEVVTMQFALSTGEMVSGPVRVQVQQLYGGWFVTGITQALIYTSRWHTFTQFP